MKKTYMVNDIFWMSFAFLVCLGGLKLGFGTFQEPHAGFIPFLSGLLLGLLALVDLVSGFVNKWRKEKADNEIWVAINWKKLILAVVVLFLYSAILTTLGFVIDTLLLLLFFFRLTEPKSLWTVLIASLATTGLCYLVFKILLSIQLPRGFLGF
jgi:hypothetical protein